jgi:type I restriction enzyme R subunit
MIQLIVERGTDGLKEVPDGIAKNEGAMSEAIENNMRKLITDEQPINPRYYDRMSELLDSLIHERKARAVEYEAYLKKLVELARQVVNPGGGMTYPKSLNTNARRALFDNLGQNEELAVALDKTIIAERQDNFRGNIFRERALKNVVRETLAKYNTTDEAELERIFEIIKNQKEY